MSRDKRADGIELTRREALRLLTVGPAAVVITACMPARSSSDGVAAPPASPSPSDALAGGRSGPPQPLATPARARTTPIDAPKPRDFGIDSDITLTPNADFYSVTYHPGEPPALDPATWRLRIDGLVDVAQELSLGDIQALPAVVEMRTLECISNPVGGNLISNAVWKGVACADVLKLAGVHPRAREVKMQAADGYHTAIPVELALHPRSLLVYEMNGEPLPAEHGLPLRCLWPGRYGQKQPKWLTHMELISGHYLGHWESQGWSNQASIRPNSQIRRPDDTTVLSPEPHVIAGLAFAGEAGVATVEVSTDDGKTWHEAELKQAPAPFTPYVWTEWSYYWQDPQPGSHTLLARVTDGAGATQQRGRRRLLLSGTFPDGTNKMHEVRVTVRRS